MAKAYGVWGEVVRDEVGHVGRGQMVHSLWTSDLHRGV